MISVEREVYSSLNIFWLTGQMRKKYILLIFPFPCNFTFCPNFHEVFLIHDFLSGVPLTIGLHFLKNCIWVQVENA